MYDKRCAELVPTLTRKKAVVTLGRGNTGSVT